MPPSRGDPARRRRALVYTFRREAEQHDRCASCLAEVVAGGKLGLHDHAFAAFVRLVTNHRIFVNPAPTALALEFVGRLQRARRSRWLASGTPSWKVLDQLVAGDSAIVGNLVPDAHLAAVAIAHGCRLATPDRGFARYPGLDWFDPAA